MATGTFLKLIVFVAFFLVFNSFIIITFFLVLVGGSVSRGWAGQRKRLSWLLVGPRGKGVGKPMRPSGCLGGTPPEIPVGRGPSGGNAERREEELRHFRRLDGQSSPAISSKLLAVLRSGLDRR